MRVRDPIHGTIPVSDEEKAVVDSRYYQRLREVRQLGFGELAFPGATHTRHAHCLGAMHLASRVFDAVASRTELLPEARERFRAAVRLALLCHDLGHLPLSHASEVAAPPRVQLQLPKWVVRHGAYAQSSHEDFTAKILLHSSLSSLIRTQYARHQLTPEALVSLIMGCDLPEGLERTFVSGGLDYAPLLRTIVSGELDADRMDYLLRDSLYTGVNYGRYDLDWILQNIYPAPVDGRVHLALMRSAAFAFEDFLLSRYHMFVSVYLHHTSVNFDHMLRCFYEESTGEFSIPSEPEAFLECDDVALLSALRKSKNPWAQRIVTRRGFKLLAQFTERDEGYDLVDLKSKLKGAGIEHFAVQSKGVLSKYFEDDAGPPLYILDKPGGRLTEIAKYTPLYRQHAKPVQLSRLYVRPDQRAQAESLLGA